MFLRIVLYLAAIISIAKGENRSEEVNTDNNARLIQSLLDEVESLRAIVNGKLGEAKVEVTNGSRPLEDVHITIPISFVGTSKTSEAKPTFPTMPESHFKTQRKSIGVEGGIPDFYLNRGIVSTAQDDYHFVKMANERLEHNMYYLVHCARLKELLFNETLGARALQDPLDGASLHDIVKLAMVPTDKGCLSAYTEQTEN